MHYRRTIALLMLLLAIMPVTATHAHYADVATQFPMPHHIAANGAVADYHGQPAKAQPKPCHLHSCPDCAVTTSFSLALAPGGAFYHAAPNSDFLSVVPSPAIKPSIFRL